MSSWKAGSIPRPAIEDCQQQKDARRGPRVPGLGDPRVEGREGWRVGGAGEVPMWANGGGGG